MNVLIIVFLIAVVGFFIYRLLKHIVDYVVEMKRALDDCVECEDEKWTLF